MAVEVDFTDRVLLGLVNDVADLKEQAARIYVQIAALAKERGIDMQRYRSPGERAKGLLSNPQHSP
jgi:hypothetical protein